MPLTEAPQGGDIKSHKLHEDRLFPSDPVQRDIARELYAEVSGLPIISPHGHTDPSWFAKNENFGNPTELFLAPDHYIYRMLYSQGFDLADLGVPDRNGVPEHDPLEAWKLFASNYHLFRGTPSRMWLDHVFAEVFGIDKRLSADTAEEYYEVIDAALKSDDFKPRALMERFNIELIATTEGSTDSLEHHEAILASGWKGGRVISAYRPDAVVDPEHEQFKSAMITFGEMMGQDVFSWKGYLEAHRLRRQDFINIGTTSSDHGHITARTADLSDVEAEDLFKKIVTGDFTAEDAELFRAQMLTEMARMSIDDGLVLQIHPGACRNHNGKLFASHGRDKGADVPSQTEYVQALKPLLNKFGNDKRLSIIVFTLDETSYSRELAPLAGHYPAMKLGPAWWFHDSPEGMRRFREMTTETAGFYNTVGFNDDTRAFLSIPARHDVARRVDCSFLARLVAEHRMQIDEAHELAVDLSYNLAKAAYKL
ncbi:glucuronate isomerase [Ponticaulis sp.]|uniref:glucuronate isomerase n=1 Tax=Ponticaulis sp. TaxID=2020902 RepID=UPI000B661EF0|nr:glucuronate isomerase [Ponticaulis sp.]MAI91519.1 glucuronate isomerase [Ponticaulis sp.]OUX97481.1 MAG: glucuronate isomerase [Hyphomonadaceae bacterium TMED5]|tara:strand:+ start:32973 stop:34418 length:1446 start_codon:yes stop_codon:yes gene_type:complete